MKNLIITSVLTVLACTTIHSQITKPKVIVNTNRVNTKPTVKGLRVVNLDKMSAKDFSKLKIPVTQVIKERVNAKPTRTWSIRPMKLMDGNLRFKSYEGLVKPEYWTFYNNNYDKIPSLWFSFRMKAFAYYRVRLIPNEQSNLEDLLLTYCSPVTSSTSECFKTGPDPNREFTYMITKPRNTTVTFSNMFADNVGSHVTIKEVIIERID